MDGPMDGGFSCTNAIEASDNDDFPTYFAIFKKTVWTNGSTERRTKQWIHPHREMQKPQIVFNKQKKSVKPAS